MKKDRIVYIIQQFQEQNEERYKAFCLENPGYIMHNGSIRAMVCDNLLKDILSIEDAEGVYLYLIDKLKEFYIKYKSSKTVNGHYVAHIMVLNILNEINGK